MNKKPIALILGAGPGLGESLCEKFSDAGYMLVTVCLLYTSPSPRDGLLSRMPSSA